MTWLAKMMTIAWVSAEERRSWWFTVGSLLILLGVVIAALLNRREINVWGHRGAEAAVYQTLACILFLPAIVALLKFGLELVGDDGPQDLPLVLPLWIILVASAIGGLAGHQSWLGVGMLVACAAGTLLLRGADGSFVRRRARIAEEIARGRLLTDPWDTEWYGRLADALTAQGKRDEALKTLQRWRVRDPWSCEPQQRLAALRSRPGLCVVRPVAATALIGLLAGGVLVVALGAFEGVMRVFFGGAPCGYRF